MASELADRAKNLLRVETAAERCSVGYGTTEQAGTKDKSKLC